MVGDFRFTADQTDTRQIGGNVNLNSANGLAIVDFRNKDQSLGQRWIFESQQRTRKRILPDRRLLQANLPN